MQGPNQGFIKKDVTLSITGSLIPYIQKVINWYMLENKELFLFQLFLKCTAF